MLVSMLEMNEYVCSTLHKVPLLSKVVQIHRDDSTKQTSMTSPAKTCQIPDISQLTTTAFPFSFCRMCCGASTWCYYQLMDSKESDRRKRANRRQQRKDANALTKRKLRKTDESDTASTRSKRRKPNKKPIFTVNAHNSPSPVQTRGNKTKHSLLPIPVRPDEIGRWNTRSRKSKTKLPSPHPIQNNNKACHPNPDVNVFLVCTFFPIIMGVRHYVLYKSQQGRIIPRT